MMKSLYRAVSGNRLISNYEEEKKLFLQIVQNLPEDQQKVLDLHFSKQLSIREIADKMQCSVTTAYNKLNRSLFILKNQFNPLAFEKAYSILYPENGKPITIASSIVSEYDRENNQSIV